MNAIGFYLAALVLAGLGVYLSLNTSPYSRLGGAKYERRRRRRDVGVILWVLAAIALCMGLISQFASGSP